MLAEGSSGMSTGPTLHTSHFLPFARPIAFSLISLILAQSLSLNINRRLEVHRSRDDLDDLNILQRTPAHSEPEHSTSDDASDGTTSRTPLRTRAVATLASAQIDRSSRPFVRPRCGGHGFAHLPPEECWDTCEAR